MSDLYYNLHKLEIAIIGGGLSGLYLANRLADQRGYDWAAQHLRVFESRNRCGGRILGTAVGEPDMARKAYCLDLGPSWLWPGEQPLMSQLVSRFKLPLLKQWQQGISLFQNSREKPPHQYGDQQTYANACRIAGGSQRVIEALQQALPESVIHTGYQLQRLQDDGGHVTLEFHSDTHSGQAATPVLVTANQVVLALPPRLAARNIGFDPELPQALRGVMESIPTWMAGQAKVAIHYPQPFWRQQGFSGAAMASFPGAPLCEIWDACGLGGQPAALGAFMAFPPQAREEWREDLKALILDQLVHLFGPQAAAPTQIEIQDWSLEPFTTTEADAELLAQHPQYGHHWMDLDHWNDKLYFCGSETSRVAGGYMEGALQSAERVASALGISFLVESSYG